MPVGPFEFGEVLDPLEGSPAFRQVTGIRRGAAVPVGAQVVGQGRFIDPVEPGIRGTYRRFFREQFQAATSLSARKDIVRMARETLGPRGIRGGARVMGGGAAPDNPEAYLAYLRSEWRNAKTPAQKAALAQEAAQVERHGLGEVRAGYSARRNRPDAVSTGGRTDYQSIYEAAYGQRRKTPLEPATRRRILRLQQQEAARGQLLIERRPGVPLRQAPIEAIAPPPRPHAPDVTIPGTPRDWAWITDPPQAQIRPQSSGVPISPPGTPAPGNASSFATPVAGAGGGGGRIPPKAPPSGAPAPGPGPRRSSSAHHRAGRTMSGARNPVLTGRADVAAQQAARSTQHLAEEAVLEQFQRRGVVPTDDMVRDATRAYRRGTVSTAVRERAAQMRRSRRLRENPLRPWIVPPKWGRTGQVLGALPGAVAGAAMGGAIGGPGGAILGAALLGVGPRRILRSVNWTSARQGAMRGLGATFETAAGLLGTGGRAALSTSLAGRAIFGRMALGAGAGAALAGLPGAGVGAALAAVPASGLGISRMAGGAARFAARSPGLAGVALGALMAVPRLFQGARRAVQPTNLPLMDIAYASHDVQMGLDPDNLNTQGLVLAMHYRK